MSLDSEAAAVQYPMLKYAKEVGWTYLSPDDAMLLRRGEDGLLLHDVFVDQIQKLNPGIVDLHRAEDVAKKLTLVKPTIEGNLQAWEYVKGLKTVFVPEQKQERNVTLIDLEKSERNTYHVTPEFRYKSGKKGIRPDIVFLINGIPVIVVEAKAATKMGGIGDALDQLRRYHEQGPELMSLLQLQTLTQLVHFYYGATWSFSRKWLFNWRDEAAGDYEALVKSFVHPRRVLRVLSDYILFTRKDQELTKVVLRPHQMRAVDRTVDRAAQGDKKRGLVWHTQGSGKTYSMITAAKKIIEHPAFENPTVIMLVDRNELEAQLFGNLEAVGFARVEVAETKKHLRELLETQYGGLLVSTIHKFDEMPADVDTRDNIIVLIDEAHRTTGGDLGNYLMGALPNATYLGFTGTPIDRTAYGKGTFKVFGADDPPQGYLDKYSIRQSIEDGTTVPLHYALAPNELRVDRETLEKEFLDLQEAEGVSDVEELDKVLQGAVTLGNMLKNKDRVEQVAKYVADHYQQTVEPMGYKAFLVAVDREACCMYKQALDEHLPPEYSEVVISRAHNDQADMRRYHLTDDEEAEARKAFRRPDDLPKILIVTQKLLTGYDAPILYAMYLDKPMRDHVLLQAIARVNRPYEDNEGRRKTNGFILDFVGLFENLEKALAFDSADVAGVVEHLDVLRTYFEEQMEKGRTEYLPISEGKAGDKAVEAVLEHFRDQTRREAFYEYYRGLEEVYEILTPDAFLHPFIKDFGRLSAMYRLLRVSYEAHVPVDKSFLRKTAKLVQDLTHTGEIEDPDRVYVLDKPVLDLIADPDKPDTVKIFNLIKVLEGEVHNRIHEAPYLIDIGKRAAEVARRFEDRLITTKVALAELAKLIEEGRAAEKERQESDLSIEGFSVFWLLGRQSIGTAQIVARQMEDTFSTYPHWKTSPHQEQEVRTEMYKALIGTVESDRLPDVVNLVLNVLKQS